MACQYQIRLFRPGTADLSDISTISALGNEHDELSKYMRRNMRPHWASYRDSCRRWLKMAVTTAGTVCYVAEERSTGEVLGWAVWSRHGKSEKAKEWQRPNSGVLKAVERRLLAAEQTYYKYVPNTDPTAEWEHMKELFPVLGEEWPKDVFPEFWELDGLYVHPQHYRKGIGKMLAVWGVERGREENVPVLVHSSPLGRRLYESVGFQVIKRMDGFDTFIPAFREDVEAKGVEEAEGCWALCWQPNGTDFVERAKRKVEEGKGTVEHDTKGFELATPAQAISVT